MNVSVPTLGGESFQVDVVIRGKDFYLELPTSSLAIPAESGGWAQRSRNRQGRRDPGTVIAGRQPERQPRSIPAVPARCLDGQRPEPRPTDDRRGPHDRLARHCRPIEGRRYAPTSQQPSASSAIASIEKLTGLHYLPIEAWVDATDHVRQIVVSATGSVEGKPFSENVQLDFVKYGPEPVPVAPPANEVTNMMSLFGTD